MPHCAVNEEEPPPHCALKDVGGVGSSSGGSSSRLASVGTPAAVLVGGVKDVAISIRLCVAAPAQRQYFFFLHFSFCCTQILVVLSTVLSRCYTVPK